MLKSFSSVNQGWHSIPRIIILSCVLLSEGGKPRPTVELLTFELAPQVPYPSYNDTNQESNMSVMFKVRVQQQSWYMYSDCRARLSYRVASARASSQPGDSMSCFD